MEMEEELKVVMIIISITMMIREIVMMIRMIVMTIRMIRMMIRIIIMMTQFWRCQNFASACFEKMSLTCFI